MPKRPCEPDKLVLPAVELTDVVEELCEDLRLLEPLLRVRALHGELAGKLVLDCLNKQSDVALAEVAPSQNGAAYMFGLAGAADYLEEFEQVSLPLVS